MARAIIKTLEKKKLKTNYGPRLSVLMQPSFQLKALNVKK